MIRLIIPFIIITGLVWVVRYAMASGTKSYTKKFARQWLIAATISAGVMAVYTGGIYLLSLVANH